MASRQPENISAINTPYRKTVRVTSVPIEYCRNISPQIKYMFVKLNTQTFNNTLSQFVG